MYYILRGIWSKLQLTLYFTEIFGISLQRNNKILNYVWIRLLIDQYILYSSTLSPIGPYVRNVDCSRFLLYRSKKMCSWKKYNLRVFLIYCLQNFCFLVCREHTANIVAVFLYIAETVYHLPKNNCDCTWLFIQLCIYTDIYSATENKYV